ncbi:MAG: 4'-phosphopantetheinyl transferase superfamily protein [Muricomes sp.]
MMAQWFKENWKVLDADENFSVSRYKLYDDRMRSASGKILARILLAEYLKCPIGDIRIKKGKYGKPIVDSACGQDILQYNVSHSGDMVALAFTKVRAVGIDIEEQKSIPEYRELAENFFTLEESSRIMKEKNIDLFFQYWTAKEAYVKALGLGLYKDFKSFYIEGQKVFDNGRLEDKWVILSAHKAEKYFISVAVEKGV